MYKRQVVGWEGEYGGFSLELFGNGNLRYCTYKLFDDIQLMQMFKVDRDTVYGIYELIQETKEEIGEIPRNPVSYTHLFRAETGMAGMPSISGSLCRSISIPRSSTMSIMFSARMTGFPSSIS